MPLWMLLSEFRTRSSAHIRSPMIAAAVMPAARTWIALRDFEDGFGGFRRPVPCVCIVCWEVAPQIDSLAVEGSGWLW